MAIRYQRIADDLRRLIRSGVLAKGERLPSEAELASQYKVSTPTLRNALEVLQGEGMVEKRHGSGNFVREPRQRIAYANDRHTAERRAPDDAALQVNITASEMTAEGDVMSLLRVGAGTPLTKYVCVSYQGASPHSVARIYVPHDVARFDPPETPRSPWGDDIREQLDVAGVHVATTVERVIARLATAEEAQALRLTLRTCVLAIARTSTDTAGRVVEAALLVLPGDRAEAVFTSHARSEATTRENGETR